LYAGLGGYSTIFDTFILVWNGIKWSAPGNVSGQVFSIKATPNGALYISGNVDSIRFPSGLVSFNNIAFYKLPTSIIGSFYPTSTLTLTYGYSSIDLQYISSSWVTLNTFNC